MQTSLLRVKGMRSSNLFISVGLHSRLSRRRNTELLGGTAAAFRKVKTKGCDVSSLEPPKQLSRRDAHSMQANHSSCTEGKAWTQARQRCMMFFNMWTFHALSFISSWLRAKGRSHPRFMGKNQVPIPVLSCDHFKSIFFLRWIYLVQKATLSWQKKFMEIAT